MVSLTSMDHFTPYATSVHTRTVRGATITVDGLGEVLRCPWHQWAFDIATGRCLADSEIRAKTYPVKIKGDDVVVEYED